MVKRCLYKLKFHGTDTDTDAPISCNFVNVLCSTRLHVFTRASLTDILARKSARVGQVGGQVGEYCRAKVGEDVRVGVGVGPMEFKLYTTHRL